MNFLNRVWAKENSAVIAGEYTGEPYISYFQSTNSKNE
jgi:hypothetical protein